ncbi:CVNH domain-containing protein [Fortiea contorta]|uniref:mannose-binding lectin n=1 Tax=Fortiea contorta TaxID=1892405 RepID=UPI0003790D96|nr:CVNH domain-containing protein [Fortiea contorta]
MLKVCATFFCAIFLTFNLLIGNAWAAGGFSQTCSNVSVNGSALSANCQRANGYTTSKTSIDLNRYVGNIDGTLKWGDSRFSLTCQQVGLAGKNRLRAECERSDQRSYLGSYINLDEHIANIDGSLKFE